MVKFMTADSGTLITFLDQDSFMWPHLLASDHPRRN